MQYPTKQQVEEANQEQLCVWYRFLPTPGMNAINANNHLTPVEFVSRKKEIDDAVDKELEIMSLIVNRWTEGGGFTPDISQKIGFNPKGPYISTPQQQEYMK